MSSIGEYVGATKKKLFKTYKNKNIRIKTVLKLLLTDHFDKFI